MIPAPWKDQAEALARWAWQRLVNRTDWHGAYGSDGPYVAKDGLRVSDLEAHFRGERVIGLHGRSTDDPPTCKWAAVDFDNHTGDAGAAAANLAAGRAWLAQLRAMGCDAILEDSDGRGGLHLLVVFDAPMAAARAKALLEHVTADWKRLGLSQAPEQFGDAGGWLRLPGRHHTRDHVSRVWGGEAWLDNAGSVSRLLATTGKPCPALERPTPAAPTTQERRSREKDVSRAQILVTRLDPRRADDYASWLQVGMALHSVGDDSLLGDWDSWSRQSPKHANGMCAAKWAGFHATRDRGLTLGSLEHWADEDQAGVLARRIAELNMTYAIIQVGKDVVTLQEQRAGDAYTGRIELLEQPDFRRLLAKEPSIPVGRRERAFADVWWDAETGRQHTRLIFDPARAPRGDDRGPYNLWRGFAVKPDAKARRAELFHEHLWKNVCGGDADAYMWVMNWVAAIVQKPAVKYGTALALRGAQGVGKTKVGEVIGKLIGYPHYVLVGGEEARVTGRFNVLLERAVFLHADEAFFAGDPKAAARLRHLITADSLDIERKGIDAYALPNYTHVLVTSNAEWIVRAASEERRWTVLDVEPNNIQDTKFFAAMDKELEAGGYARLMWELLTQPLDDARLRSVHATAALDEQKYQSLDPEADWLLEILHRGNLPGDPEGTGATSYDVLHADYLNHVNAHFKFKNARASQTKLGIFLKKALPGVTRVEAARRWLFPPLPVCRTSFVEKYRLTKAPWGDNAGPWKGSTGMDLGRENEG